MHARRWVLGGRSGRIGALKAESLSPERVFVFAHKQNALGFRVSLITFVFAAAVLRIHFAATSQQLSAIQQHSRRIRNSRSRVAVYRGLKIPRMCFLSIFQFLKIESATRFHSRRGIS